MQKLLPLSLERAPAAELIEGSALAWCEAIGRGKRWDEGRDAPRFREAFRSLMGRCRSWPAPIDFLEALPRIETPTTTEPRLASEGARAAGARAIGDIAALLKIEPVKPHTEVDA